MGGKMALRGWVVGLLVVAMGMGVSGMPQTPTFEDISARVGLRRWPLMEKNFGSAIADLNRDGHPELILCNHHNGTEIYWHQEDGTYRFDNTIFHANETPPPFYIHAANQHGFAAGDLDDDGDFDFLGSINERFRGETGGVRVTFPYVAEVEGNSFSLNGGGLTGLDTYAMYGRTVRVLDMTGNGRLDVLMLNNVRQGRKHVVYYNAGGGRFEEQSGTGIENALGAYGGLLDANNDKQMDMLLTASTRADLFVSTRKLVGGAWRPGWTKQNYRMPMLDRVKNGHAVVEFDFDNDGLLDVYIATGFRQGPIGGSNDFLLKRKADGTYMDVTASANIPRLGAHLSVTAADFNNDSYMDLVVGRVAMSGTTRVPELLLLNRGNGSFQQVELPPVARRFPGEMVDSVNAFDYDQDGRMDLIVGAANTRWSLLRNKGTYPGHFIQLQIGKHTRSRTESRFNRQTLGALVEVFAGGKKFVQRVGSRGESHSQSYFELLHFGLGSITSVNRVVVRFGSGIGQWKARNLPVDSPPIKVGLRLDYGLRNRS